MLLPPPPQALSKAAKATAVSAVVPIRFPLFIASPYKVAGSGMSLLQTA